VWSASICLKAKPVEKHDASCLRGVIWGLLLLLIPRLSSQPSVAIEQPPLAQTLELRLDFVALERHLVGVGSLGPEVGHTEAAVEVGAKVVHDPDWEHQVHAELGTAWQSQRLHAQGTDGAGRSTKTYLEHFEVEAPHVVEAVTE
jgi:hypothetical protein